MGVYESIEKIQGEILELKMRKLKIKEERNKLVRKYYNKTGDRIRQVEIPINPIKSKKRKESESKKEGKVGMIKSVIDEEVEKNSIDENEIEKKVENEEMKDNEQLKENEEMKGNEEMKKNEEIKENEEIK